MSENRGDKVYIFMFFWKWVVKDARGLVHTYPNSEAHGVMGLSFVRIGWPRKVGHPTCLLIVLEFRGREGAWGPMGPPSVGNDFCIYPGRKHPRADVGSNAEPAF